MKLLFVGPLPPPMNGFSSVTAAMALELEQETELIRFDTGRDQGVRGLSAVLLRFLFAALVKRRVLYLALSGGLRQWIDLLFILMASVRSPAIYIHHHSFGYINDWRLSTWIVARASSRVVHIVLCEAMAKAFASRYGVSPKSIRVVSNAAVLDVEPTRVVKIASGCKVLGFISNITESKGIFEFLEILMACEAWGIQVSAQIAGGVDAAIQERFAAVLARLPDVVHLGPVYGVGKEKFFREIDVLVFPTKYANEAEPLVLLEALSVGVPVIAFRRGCIESIVPEKAGVVLNHDENFIAEVCQLISGWRANPGEFHLLRLGALSAFREISATQSLALSALLIEMLLRASA